MSNRKREILHLLVIEKLSSEIDIMEKLGISQRQFDYSVSQINHELVDLGIESIVKRDGRLLYSKQTSNLMLLNSEFSKNVFSVESRRKLIPLIILMLDEYISLNHISYILGVSRNTIIQDISECKTMLMGDNLSIEYTRKRGYYITGSELEKRIVIKNSISEIYTQYGEKYVTSLISSNTNMVHKASRTISDLEKILEIKYTDEDYNQLILFIGILLTRISNGHIVQYQDINNMYEIRETREYSALKYALDDTSIPEEEYLYMTLHILGSKSREIGAPVKINLPLLESVLWEFLSEFEENTLSVLMNKRDLLEKLTTHFKPAYYRIKYNLSVENVLYDQIVSKYSVLHNFVKQSIGPINRLFETELSDIEISYITMFVGGHLTDNGENDLGGNIVKAVIVCPNGMSMSMIIASEIRSLFPEFQLYNPVSVREYQSFLLPHTLVFSTVPLDTNKKVFVIPGMLTLEQKISLRREVIGSLFNINFGDIGLNKVMEVVNRYSKVENEEKLSTELENLFLEIEMETESNVNHSGTSSLLDVLESSIIVVREHIEWEEALNRVSKKLEERGLVSNDFARELGNEFKHKPNYIMLRQRILLPHLDPTRIKMKLGISVLVSTKGIEYNGEKINLVMALTSPDKISHLNILMDIKDIAKNKEIVSKIAEANSNEQVYLLISDFLNGRYES